MHVCTHAPFRVILLSSKCLRVRPNAHHLSGWSSSPHRGQSPRRPCAAESNRAGRVGGRPVRVRVAQELDGIGYATAELREDAQIRPLLLNDGQTIALACPRSGHTPGRAVPGGSRQYRQRSARPSTPALRTSATVKLRRLLIDEGPQMLRLRRTPRWPDELTSADPKTSDSVRDFVLGTGETSTI